MLFPLAAQPQSNPASTRPSTETLSPGPPRPPAIPKRQRAKTSAPLFYINGKGTAAEEFIYLYRKNHQHKPEEFTREKIEEYLGLFINYKLKVEEALARGMDTTTVFRKEYKTYRDELLKPHLPDARVIDSLVALTYQRLREEVNASHILIRLKPDANPQDTLEAFNRISALRKRALAGEDFGALAAEFSEEPGAETTRGNLGYFTAMQMVFPFERAAYLTPVGQVSEPVRTQFGYHIVKVLDRQPSRGEVEISHIMIRVPDAGGEEAARNTIFDIFDKLQKGVKWDELCAQYSDDLNTRASGGKLPPFGVGTMASMPGFQSMAFSLREPGEISDPVRTQYGWHILKLESKIPLPPFEELKASLTQRVSRDERVKISREALREKLRREYGYNERTRVKTLLMEHADAVIRHEELSVKGLSDSVLFSMAGRSFTVGNFLDFAMTAPRPAPGTASAEQQLDELIKGYTDEVQLGILEDKVKRESPDYGWLLKEYYEGILLFEIMEREVWNKAMEDSTGQRSYFISHAEKYRAGERMVGKIFHSTSVSHLEQLKERLLRQEDVTEFLAVNSIRRDSGAFQQADRSIFSEISWSPGIYLVENKSMSALVVIDQILPPGPQTFEEARASVISDYQSFLEDSWIRELKRKFVVEVDRKAKKRAFAQLIDKRE